MESKIIQRQIVLLWSKNTANEQQKTQLKQYQEKAQEVSSLRTFPFTMERIRLHKYVDEAKGISLFPKWSYT